MVNQVSTIVNVGKYTGNQLEDLESLCKEYNVSIVDVKKLGGIINKTYQVTLEGSDLNLAKVITIFKGWIKKANQSGAFVKSSMNGKPSFFPAF